MSSIELMFYVPRGDQLVRYSISACHKHFSISNMGHRCRLVRFRFDLVVLNSSTLSYSLLLRTSKCGTIGMGMQGKYDVLINLNRTHFNSTPATLGSTLGITQVIKWHSAT